MKTKPVGRKSTPSAARATVRSAAPRAVKKPAKGTSPAKAAKSPVARPSSSATRDTSKQAQLIAALGAANGTTIKQMMAVTGWQAHTVRGTISGVLRKKLGLNVACEASAESGERVYRIVGSAVPA